MKTHKLLFALMACAMVVFATVSCEKEEITPDIINDTADTAVTPDLPDYGGYVIFGDDTMTINHIVLLQSNGHNIIKVFLNGHPDEVAFLSFDDYEPSEERQGVLYCFGSSGGETALYNGEAVVSVSDGIYTIEFDNYYEGKRMVIHYLGPISDVTIPAGMGTFVFDGDTASVYYNDCQFAGGDYNIFFRSHTAYVEGDYSLIRITLGTPVAPGTYNFSDEDGFFPIIVRGKYFSDTGKNCVLTISREGEMWTLRVTGTFQDDDFEFTYSGALNFEYLTE